MQLMQMSIHLTASPQLLRTSALNHCIIIHSDSDFMLTSSMHAGYDIAQILLNEGEVFCYITNLVGPEHQAAIHATQALATEPLVRLLCAVAAFFRACSGKLGTLRLL